MSSKRFLPPDRGTVERRIPYPKLDLAFYERVLQAERTKPVVTAIVPRDSGRSVKVKAGQIARVICLEGPQIADICFFNANDSTEHLWASQTLLREGCFLTTGSRLWGTMPNYRPLMTIVVDTVKYVDTGTGARSHVIAGGHCPSWYWYLATGVKNHPNCHDQLISAAKDVDIDESLVHDNLNLFQKSRIDSKTGHYVTEASDAKTGDYVEFYAEIDVIMAISTCPLGSGKFRAELDRRDPTPLGVDIYDIGIEPQEFSYEGLRTAFQPPA